MIHTADTTAGPSRATQLRQELTDKLMADGMIASPAVERAFRTVPRELFVPADTPLEKTYSADSPVVVKTGANGQDVSSVSATYIQARMLELAAVGPGMTVLEIGSGGYNAALLAEVVGAGGHVVSIDIDAEITNRASELLDTAGHGSRVTVMHADAADPVPDAGPFDRTVVTVGAWDISPVWLEQLAPQGVLVVPLRMNGITRTIAFRRVGEHLESIGTEVAGFVPMQGLDAYAERTFRMPDGHGKHIELRFDERVPEAISGLDGVLAAPPVSAWSGVTIPNGVSFTNLHLWFAAWLPGFCRIAAERGTEMAGQLCKTWFPFATVFDDSLAYLAVRPAPQIDGVEFGATAFGPHGQDAAAVMVSQIQAWDSRARDRAEPMFAFWPAGADAPVFLDDRTAVLPKRHGVVTISWPEPGDDRLDVPGSTTSAPV